VFSLLTSNRLFSGKKDKRKVNILNVVPLKSLRVFSELIELNPWKEILEKQKFDSTKSVPQDLSTVVGLVWFKSVEGIDA